MNRLIRISRVPHTFCEGPFWGSGLLGSMMYVTDTELHLTLDHPRLWEMRETLPDVPRADFEAILAHQDEYRREDPAYAAPTDIFRDAIGRTRLPSMHLTFPVGHVDTFEAVTDLERAYSTITLTADGRHYSFSVWLDSIAHVLHLDVDEDSTPLPVPSLHGWDLDRPALAVLKRWNYLSPDILDTPGALTLRQAFSGDNVALMQVRESSDSMHLAIALELGEAKAEGELLKTLCRRTHEAIASREEALAMHTWDWRSFWDTSSVEIPDPMLQEAYDLEMYKLYCNERSYGLPVTLQGIWNPDTRMPPWYGDLHNDLNVQSCYWPVYKTGHADLARAYIDTYTRAIPRLRERAEKLFHLRDAIHIPTMMAPDGTGAASEWCYWNTVLGPELFVAVDFVWYYLYTLDVERLKSSVLPMLQGVLNLYQGISYADENGTRHIPFTFSPEVNCMHPDSTFTLSSLHYLCDFYKRHAASAGMDPEAFSAFADSLAVPVADEKGYPLYAGVPVYGSHRHFCQMYPVFPLGTDMHSETAERSLDTIVNHGMLEYAAFSFPYTAIFASRVGRGNMARTMNILYCLGFRSPNSFTVNGDPYQNGLLTIQENLAGEASDAFTLESGFFIPTAICEMLVHRGEYDVWLFYGVPDDWRCASFHHLTLEGNLTVSAAFDEDRLVSLRLTPGLDETVTMHVLPRLIPGGKPLTLDLRAGEKVLLTAASFGGEA